MKIKSICTCFLILSILFISSCATYTSSSDEYYGGESLNAEILSEIAESIFNEDNSQESGESNENSSSSSPINGVYYWTDGGSVYHKYSDCGHLKNSENIRFGSKQEAELAGKTKMCSTCDKKN